MYRESVLFPDRVYSVRYACSDFILRCWRARKEIKKENNVEERNYEGCLL